MVGERRPRLGGRRFDVRRVRRDFPALQQVVNGRPLVWLDNAATSHKPAKVIEAVRRFSAEDNSNVHRGVHALAERATRGYDAAREAVRRSLGAESATEIVFVRGATEAINLAAHSLGRLLVGPGDEIVVTTLEHHANIVPWQVLAADRSAYLRVAGIDDSGAVDMRSLERLLGPRTRIVAVAHVSNVLGTEAPVAEIVERAHRVGARVLVDGAQAVPHRRVDVRALGADLYAFSGHKLFGPMGIGVLYARQELLEAMPPWQSGGGMIREVTFERTTYAPPPLRFEAGTPNVAGAIGLHAALDYLDEIDFDAATRHEDLVMEYARECLERVPGLRMISNAPKRIGAVSFTLAGADPEALGTYLDAHGIALRIGHHCAQPTLRRYDVEYAIRPSLAFYNTTEEVDSLVDALRSYARRRPV